MAEITDISSEDAVARELGSRLRQIRLNQGLSQAETAELAGLSELTVRKAEGGELGQTRSFLRLLRALGLVHNLNAAVPQTPSSPIAESDRGGRPRLRAPRAKPDSPTRWSWGDDE